MFACFGRSIYKGLFRVGASISPPITPCFSQWFTVFTFRNMHFSSLLVYACGIASVLCDVSISSFPNSLTLAASFNPIKEAYWTGLPHHRRTPFAISPDGKSAYIAYLDSTLANVHVQQVDVTTFAAVGSAVSVAAFEAAGLVAQNDGFALMATVKPTGSTDIPPNSYTVVALIRFKNGVEAWRTMLNGPGVHAADGVSSKDGDKRQDATAYIL